MTPMELRQKSEKFIKSAKAILSIDPTIAVYLCGYAIEFSLKARICSSRGWSNFPSNRAEFRALSKKVGTDPNERLFVHDLDELLSISETTFIKTSSYEKIDWDKALNWSEQLRYQPNETVDIHTAREFVAEIEKVQRELKVLELSLSLLKIEKTFSDSHGPLHFFGLLEGNEEYTWDLWASWYSKKGFWQSSNHGLQKMIFDIDFDLREALGIKIFPPNDERIGDMLHMCWSFGGYRQRAFRSVMKDCVINRYSPPSGYIITAVNWSPEQLETAWSKLKIKSND